MKSEFRFFIIFKIALIFKALCAQVVVGLRIDAETGQFVTDVENDMGMTPRQLGRYSSSQDTLKLQKDKKGQMKKVLSKLKKITKNVFRRKKLKPIKKEYNFSLELTLSCRLNSMNNFRKNLQSVLNLI